MLGLMMDWPLTIRRILDRAHTVYPEKEIVSMRVDGSMHRMTYADLYRRVCRLMNVLRDLGVKPGDRVASFAWNSHHHLELYFAVPCLGAVLHTLNIRLPAEQIRYLIGHAEDRLIFLDSSLTHRLAEAGTAFPTVEKFVVMDDGTEIAASPLAGALDYETLLSDASEAADFPEFDENTAAGLCYTSGTTGDPKGVLYSHRSFFLHAMGICMADSFAISERETVLPVVPMFHANSWGVPYAATLTGAKLVFPGPHLLGGPLAQLMEREKVTFSPGVPTIWNLLYQHLKQHPHDLSSIHTLLFGGSSAPPSLIENFERDFGIRVLHAWGMTETSPVGLVSRIRGEMAGWPYEKQLAQRAKQGISIPGVETRILDEENRDLPWDGKQPGELIVRGPWVARGYYREESLSAFTEDGWFRTGDVATIDRFGYVEITDRKKDVIKSRGEWISSVEMENQAMSHPGVLEAAVVAKIHPVRGETPVVFAMRVQNYDPPATPRDVLNTLSMKFAKWQLPRLADILFVDSIAKTGVGKFDKKALRKQLEESN